MTLFTDWVTASMEISKADELMNQDISMEEIVNDERAAYEKYINNQLNEYIEWESLMAFAEECVSETVSSKLFGIFVKKTANGDCYFIINVKREKKDTSDLNETSGSIKRKADMLTSSMENLLIDVNHKKIKIEENPGPSYNIRKRKGDIEKKNDNNKKNKKK